ncbi:MAG: metal-dependent hydrolase [Chloroflexota bacterium]|nr:MAG: hypothetical protein KatS3mg045_0484 [Bellilinea sp.]
MPVTPFHFGAGLAAKAVLPRHFGFLAFCTANILIDVEPLYYILTGQYPLHRFFHTLPGAIIVSLCTVVLFWILKIAWAWLGWGNRLTRFEFKPSAVWLGALSGTISHVFLDSIVHGDVHPFSPFSQANPFLGWFSISQVQTFLTLMGVLGMGGWMLHLLLLRLTKETALNPHEKNRKTS